MEYQSLTIPKISKTRSDDLIFIEARNLADRLSEDSDLEQLDYGVLDFTIEPNWAPQLDEIDTNLQNSISELNNSSQISTTKQMLDNLSDILNCTHRSEEQKSEGTLILISLIDLLNNSVEVDSEDSGHSSIGQKSPQRDLVEEQSPKPAVKINKLINSEYKANNSLTTPKHKKLSTNINIKFKSKSSSCEIKKGPLKPLFPVEKMIKPFFITPENKKNALSMKSSTPFNKNKSSFSTSTPNESPVTSSASKILKPIRGTRVETTNKSFCVKPRRNSDASIQLLKKPSITTAKLVNNCIPVRRNSISEGMTNKKLKLNYNNSLVKETGISSGLPKFTTKITNSISARSVSFKMKKNQENVSS